MSRSECIAELKNLNYESETTNFEISDNFFGEKFLHNVFGDFLIKKYNFIKIKGVLYYFNGKIYTRDNIESIILQHIPFLKKNQRKEVIDYINAIIIEDTDLDNNYIALKNGIYNWTTFKLEDFSKTIILTNQIPIDYKIFDSDNLVMDKIMIDFANGDEKLKELLYEVIGYCLYQDYKFHKIFIIIGNGANGKTKFTKMLTNIVGEDNTSHTDIKDICNNRFGKTQILNKLLNIADDCSGNYLNDISELKKLTGESPIEIEFKGKDKFCISCNAKIILTYNTLPQINDTSNGINRRLMIIPFSNDFSKNGDGNINEKIATPINLEYIVYKSIQAFSQCLQQGDFTKVNCVTEATNSYIKSNSIVLQFLEDYNIENIITTQVYEEFKKWCFNNSVKLITNNIFGKELRKLGFSTIQKSDGKRVYNKL